MTAPIVDKPSLTRERVEWFGRYYKQNPSWGAFHVALADANYEFGAAEERWSKEPWTAELREAVIWFNQLSPSQRRRLQLKAEDFANTIRRTA